MLVLYGVFLQVNDLHENVSALHLASRNGHKAIVKLLIERGFDINLKVIQFKCTSRALLEHLN